MDVTQPERHWVLWPRACHLSEDLFGFLKSYRRPETRVATSGDHAECSGLESLLQQISGVEATLAPLPLQLGWPADGFYLTCASSGPQ